MGETLEQRIYDVDNNLTQETIFGEYDEWGFRKSMVEKKYLNDKLLCQIFSKYEHEYF